MEKPSRGGEKRTTVWVSHHEERGSDGAVAPPMCDHRVVLHRCVVREGCNPSGSTGATCLHAAARTRRAARAVQGDVLSVWQVLHGTSSAPPIPAQRVARFDDHCTRNCLLKNKLRQRYSRSRHMCPTAEPHMSELILTPRTADPPPKGVCGHPSCTRGVDDAVHGERTRPSHRLRAAVRHSGGELCLARDAHRRGQWSHCLASNRLKNPGGRRGNHRKFATSPTRNLFVYPSPPRNPGDCAYLD
jgi:hypothetical protein